jgi:hypothetical protein
MRVRIALLAAVACVLVSGLVAALATGHDGPRGKALFGELNGRNEIGPDGRRGAGDPDGRGSATAIIDGDQLCFGLTASNLDTPVSAHIHRGNRRENGEIVVTLVHPAAGDPGASSGCVKDVDPELVRALLRRPHRFYWNIHTGAFPDGAIRGQLFTHRR